MEHETAPAASYFSPEVFLQDPAFWAFVGLLGFIAIVLWRRAPAMVTKSLDDRAAAISADLANAERLRVEAEQKLAQAEKQAQQAAAEAEAIVAAARKEAAQLAVDAQTALADRIARREKLAEERIARAEADAMRDVRMAAIDTASRAAALVLTETLQGDAADRQFATSLDAVKRALSQ